MSYPNITAPLRTDTEFRNRTDSDHHNKTSPLEELPINMVDDFPVADSLHLLDLGIMKRCLKGFTHGSFNFRTKWSARDIEEISNWLQLSNKFKPVEIHRAIRKLDSLSFWKGVEFRTFLLYLGIVILKMHLPNDAYHHFLLLFCAVTICTSEFYHHHLDLADRLLHDYIEQYITIYGIDSINSNVHNLCHMVNDVKKFGPLPNFSAYPFENRLGYIKRLLRNGNRPLPQIAKRLGELSDNEISIKNEKKFPFLSNEQKNIVHPVKDCKNIFNSIEIQLGFHLKTDERNQWFMTNNNIIVKMINATEFHEELYIFGQSIKKLKEFFERPIKSSKLNIYCSDALQFNPASLYKICDIKCKLFSIPYKQNLVFVPIIHTLT